MGIAAVILNYNDANETVDAVRRIDGFSCFDHIIVVDNASTDGSAEMIASALDLPESRETGGFLISGRHEKAEDTAISDETTESARILLVHAPRNGGYGYGNNLGVRIASELCGAELAVIANPDAAFSEELVADMAAVFRRQPGAAVVGAVMETPMKVERKQRPRMQNADASIRYLAYIRSGWKRRGLPGQVLNGGPLMSRIFRRWLNYPYSHYRAERGIADDGGESATRQSGDRTPPAVEVYAVHGSLLMVSVSRFLDMGGYDERMFLYGEENVLGEKCRRAGWQSFLLCETYEHAGSKSITGSGLNALRRQQLRIASENYFYQHYLGAGRLAMALVWGFQRIVLLETALLGRFL